MLKYLKLSIFSLVFMGLFLSGGEEQPTLKNAFAKTNPIQSLEVQFNDSAWENDSVIDMTNCYTYAIRLADAGWSLPGSLKTPGRGKGTTEFFEQIIGHENITAKFIDSMIQVDDFIPITREEALTLSPKLNVIFACYVDPHEDFHAVRRDSQYWSHKMGNDIPERLEDYDGSPWIPPEGAYNTDYTELVGFYTTPQEGIYYIPYKPQ